MQICGSVSLLVPSIVMRLRMCWPMNSMGAMAGTGLGPVWAIMVGGLEVDQPRESLAPSLFEVGGKKVANEGRIW